MVLKRKGVIPFLSDSIHHIKNKLTSDPPIVLSPRFNSKHLFKNIPIQLLPNNYKKIYILTDQPLHGTDIKGGIVISSVKALTPSEIKDALFYVYFLCDSDALPEIRRILENDGKFIPHLNYDKNEYRFVNRLALNALSKTVEKVHRISHFDMIIHENICEALDITKNLNGDFVEIGVYKGGSALTAINFIEELNLASSNLNISKKAWLLDTYDGFFYDSASGSQDLIWNETHRLFGVEKTMEYVTKTLSGTNVNFELVENNICCDSIPHEVRRISVANIDVDMYEPTKAALEKISPLVVAGGIIICEDAVHTPALYGAFVAMEDFLETPEGSKYIKVHKFGQYFLIKNNH